MFRVLKAAPGSMSCRWTRIYPSLPSLSGADVLALDPACGRATPLSSATIFGQVVSTEGKRMADSDPQ